MKRVALCAVALLLAGCGWHGLGALTIGANPSPDQVPPSASPSAAPTTPPSSAIDWKPNLIRKTSTGVSLFSGTVTNTTDRWLIKGLAVELKLIDANGNVRQTQYGQIQDLGPGDKGDYTIAVPAEEKFELSNLRLIWTWELR